MALRSDRGSSIVEVMMSALLMVMIGTAVFGALEATGRAGSEERHRSRAYAVAQADQARLRSLQVSEVTRISQTRSVVQDGTTYTVHSTGTPKLDRTTSANCDSGNSPSDYIAISSRVTWPSMGSRPPVIIESLIAPPNGSFDVTRGALGVSIVDSTATGYSGITITGTGGQSFSGITDSTGCVIFGDLPAGNYVVTPAVSNLVDKDGNAPGGRVTSVIAGSSNTLSFQFDKGGTLKATFTTMKPGSTTPVASSTDTVMVFNSGMTQAERFGTIGTDLQTQTATPLFPFTSPDTMYAGGCTTNNPGTGLALASVTVPQNGGTAATQAIRLPALALTAYEGNNGNSTRVNGARVTVTDQDCSVDGTPYRKVLATSGAGTLAASSATSADNPGLPYGVNYDICVSGLSSSGSVKRFTFSNVQLTSPTTPTDLGSLYLNRGQLGACP